MTLGQRQRIFTHKIAQLINHAYLLGYELTFGDAARMDERDHSKDSFHYIRLAVDFNLFRDEKYLTETSDHEELGAYWESIGGTWGGRFGDGNHYSWGED